MTINDGNATTSIRRVKLSLRADGPAPGSEAVEMRLMNGGGSPWMEWRKYATQMDWKLSKGEGQKVVYASTNREVFETYLKDVLCSTLMQGQVVVMDNLSAHEGEGKGADRG